MLSYLYRRTTLLLPLLTIQCIQTKYLGDTKPMELVHDDTKDDSPFSHHKGCNCGVPNRRTRTIGGVKTEANEYPWQVGLIYEGKEGIQCGGSLIDSKTVLTAAHCTEGMDPNEIYVLVGEHDQEDSNDGQQKIQVQEVIEHPDYSGRPVYDNDFSILILQEPVTWSKEVKPICLPQEIAAAYEGVEAIVSGWGETEYAYSSSVLMETEVTTMSNTECTRPNSIWKPWEITTNMICAFKPGNDACHGDSGGPLITKESAHYSLIGVVSFGMPCGAQHNYRGVYARVTARLDWIKRNMKGTTCPAP